MKYLLVTTVAGSILFAGYWLWIKLFASYMTQSMKFRAVSLVVFVYVVPWVWLKGIYSSVMTWILQVRAPESSGLPVAIADVLTEEKAYRTSAYQWEYWLVVIWLAVAVALIIYRSVNYFHNKIMLLDVSDKCTDEGLEELTARLRKELNYKGRLEIYVTPLNDTSFTLGFIRPVIFVQRNYAEGQLEFILKHEMMHMIRRDMAVKLLLEFACCLHWFNPFIYVLSSYLDLACEESCDERIIKGMTYDEREAYSRLLVDSIKELLRLDSRHQKRLPFSSRLKGTRDIEERVNLIMGAKEIRSWRKRVGGGIFAALLVVNSFTAMAYPDVYHVENGSSEIGALTADGGAYWTDEGTGISCDFIDPQEAEELAGAQAYPGDVFIDEEGNVYPVDEDLVNSHVICFKHDIRKGYYQTHQPDGKGGCTVKSYESERCTICNTIWIGDLSSTLTYVKCPHDR